MLRSLPILAICAHSYLSAQIIHGSIQGVPEGCLLVLHENFGTRILPLDSVSLDAAGRFAFTASSYPTGFYQLAINDTDRVDIILSSAEPELKLSCSATPLQEHITILISEENRRLWSYKAISREAQLRIAAAETSRSEADPMDLELIQTQDSIILEARAFKDAALLEVVRNAPTSYFAKVIMAGKQLDALRGVDPMLVLTSFPFDDPSLVRSSVYPQAVMTFLRNLSPESETQFIGASDTLITLASGHPQCRKAMIAHLLDVLGTYGPDLPFQHIVDRYLTDPGVVSDLPAEIKDKIRAFQRVTLGARAPEIELPVPGADTLHLADIIAAHRAVLLLFYSSTCDHCREQVPTLKELHAAFGGKDLAIVGIALDDRPEDFLAFREELAIPWLCSTELLAWGADAARAFAVQATPSFFLLDQQGSIRSKPYDAVEAFRDVQDLLQM
ncbi:MAG: TlpA family protein disulfide reductase [Flavobacteriales bacterium]|nr:TlpA family protein disulfide reductase [Flavobacteriales bacterium]